MTRAKVVFPEVGQVVRVTSLHSKTAVIGLVLENNGTAIVYERWNNGVFCRTRDDCVNVQIDELNGASLGVVAYYTLFAAKSWDADERLVEHILPGFQYFVYENLAFSERIRARAVQLMNESGFEHIIWAENFGSMDKPMVTHAIIERCGEAKPLSKFLYYQRAGQYRLPAWQQAWDRLGEVGGEDAWHDAIQAGQAALKDPWPMPGQRPDLGTQLTQSLLERVARKATNLEVCRDALVFLDSPQPIVDAMTAAVQVNDLKRVAWLFVALAAAKLPKTLPSAVLTALGQCDWKFVDGMSNGQGLLDHKRQRYLDSQHLRDLVAKKAALVPA